jgi:hypothetical protein
MEEYTPDYWVMVKFTHEENVTFKILASWNSSYLSGSSWRMNSGITKIEEDGQCYLFYGHSGSVYRCHKSRYGMNGYTSAVYGDYEEKFKKSKSTMEIIDENINFMEIDYGMGSS